MESSRLPRLLRGVTTDAPPEEHAHVQGALQKRPWNSTRHSQSLKVILSLLEAKPNIVTVSQDFLQIAWDVADSEYDRFVRSRAHVQQVAKRHRHGTSPPTDGVIHRRLVGQEPDLWCRCRHNTPRTSTNEIEKNFYTGRWHWGGTLGHAPSVCESCATKARHRPKRRTCSRLSSCFKHAQPLRWNVTDATSFI